jgi:hypothetical protein
MFGKMKSLNFEDVWGEEESERKWREKRKAREEKEKKGGWYVFLFFLFSSAGWGFGDLQKVPLYFL